MDMELDSKKDPMSKYSLSSEINSLTFENFLENWGQFVPKMMENDDISSKNSDCDLVRPGAISRGHRIDLACV